MPGHNQTGAGCVLGFANAFFTRWEEKNKKYTHSTVLVVASSSSCAEVSSTDSGFTSWLTVSITIMGMIGSFKSALKSLMYRLPLYISLGCNTTPQWNKEMACIRLFLFVLIAFFGFVTQIPCSILTTLTDLCRALNVLVLSNQTGLLSGHGDYIKE